MPLFLSFCSELSRFPHDIPWPCSPCSAFWKSWTSSHPSPMTSKRQGCPSLRGPWMMLRSRYFCPLAWDLCGGSIMGDYRGTYVLTCFEIIKKDHKGSKNKIQSNGLCRSLDADLSDLMFINQPSKKIEPNPTKRVTQHCSIQQHYNMLFMVAVTIAHLSFTYTIIIIAGFVAI